MLKFFAEKMWVAFAVQKLLTFFSAKNIRILYIESAKTVNEMTLNELVKLTTLWTTGPWTLAVYTGIFFMTRLMYLFDCLEKHSADISPTAFIPKYSDIQVPYYN